MPPPPCYTGTPEGSVRLRVQQKEQNVASHFHHPHPRLSVAEFISLSLPHSSHSLLSSAPALLLMPVIC